MRRIQQTAQEILDARALYLDSNLSNLYDEISMPPELRKVHAQNDKTVIQAYGFSIQGYDGGELCCGADKNVSATSKNYKKITNISLKFVTVQNTTIMIK